MVACTTACIARWGVWCLPIVRESTQSRKSWGTYNNCVDSTIAKIHLTLDELFTYIFHGHSRNDSLCSFFFKNHLSMRKGQWRTAHCASSIVSILLDCAIYSVLFSSKKLKMWKLLRAFHRAQAHLNQKCTELYLVRWKRLEMYLNKLWKISKKFHESYVFEQRVRFVRPLSSINPKARHCKEKSKSMYEELYLEYIYILK